MKHEFLKIIRSPCCKSELTLSEQINDDMEIIEGILKCNTCLKEYQIHDGMPLLYIDDANWISKAKEAKGWVELHKHKRIYDQTGVNIDFILPYFENGDWIKVAKMFDICQDILDLKGSERILDLGAARSWAAKHFALKGCESVAIDIVPDDQIGLGRSKALMKEANTYYERVIGDNENLPFVAGTFNIVFCAAVLHHSSNLGQLLKNVFRVMNDGGTFIAINEPCISIFDNESRLMKDSEEIKYNINETRPNINQYYRALMEAGFTDIHIFPYQSYGKSCEEPSAIDKTKIDKLIHKFPYLLGSRSKYLINGMLLLCGGEVLITAKKIKKMKLAFVVQRYGLEVNGGAEHSCRLTVEHLSKYHDIEVLTTCAKDYMTWKNEYKEGETRINNILVRRFKVDKERNIKKFNDFTEHILKNLHSDLDEQKWIEDQGPYVPKMLDYIDSHKNEYDFFIFFTFRYYHSFFGLPLVKDKSILVPTAENDFTLDFRITKTLFSLPKYLIYHTEEEKDLIDLKFRNENISSDVIGVGIDVPEKINPEDFKKKYNINNFIIYLGRIDESKGCKELFNYFINYKKAEKQSDIKLVLLGKAVMKVPNHPDIISLGFVSEQDKFNGLKAAKLLIMPSRYESFSMVTMESWLCNNAVLVNGNCEVLKGHCIKSNGGLYYTNYEEFRECLNLLLHNSMLRARMGMNGRQYVEENYGWDVVERKYLDLLALLKRDCRVTP